MGSDVLDLSKPIKMLFGDFFYIGPAETQLLGRVTDWKVVSVGPTGAQHIERRKQNADDPNGR